MRGKLDGTHPKRLSGRITPADAGKTMENGDRSHRLEDHPRACGENVSIFYNCNVSKGSPPRMRGKLYFVNAETKERRITPAHAGKTRPARLSSWVAQDHPRACGENVRSAVLSMRS